MTDSAAPADPGGSNTVVRDTVVSDTVVSLELPADVAFTGVARSLAANLAARLPFTIDEIDDLRIAVDEAFALLLPLAAPGSTVRTSFTLGEGAIDVGVDVDAATGRELDRGGFSWTVLDALAQVADVRESDARVGLTLHKDAEEAVAAGVAGPAGGASEHPAP